MDHGPDSKSLQPNSDLIIYVIRYRRTRIKISNNWVKKAHLDSCMSMGMNDPNLERSLIPLLP